MRTLAGTVLKTVQDKHPPRTLAYILKTILFYFTVSHFTIFPQKVSDTLTREETSVENIKTQLEARNLTIKYTPEANQNADHQAEKPELHLD